MVSTLLLMDAFYELEQMSFPDFLSLCLEEHQRSILDFYDYLIEQDYPIDSSSNLYRHFSSTPSVYRKPNEPLICLFAEFLQLSPQREAALYLLWSKKRREHLRPKGKHDGTE